MNHKKDQEFEQTLAESEFLLRGAARSASESEIPISILTAVIGAPIFIALLKKTGGSWR